MSVIKKVLWFLFLIPLTVLAGCDFVDLGGFFLAGSDVDERFEWSLDESPPAPVAVTGTDFRFLAVTDTHYYKQDTPQPHFAALAALAESEDLFLLVNGDLMQSGSATSHTICQSDIASVGVPYYVSLGNHDIYNEGWRPWRRIFGPSVYSLDCGDLRLICLDSANGTLGGPQYRWLEDELSAADEPRIIVMTHANFFGLGAGSLQQFTDTEERFAVMALFERHEVDLVLSGHAHAHDDRTVGGVRYLTMDTFHVKETPRYWYRITFTSGGISVSENRL